MGIQLKTIAISQSNYLPWRGYFSIIDQVDNFVFLDNVQFTKRDWRTRNQIKTPQGLKWLSIPIASKVKRGTKISEVQIKDKSFIFDHLEIIRRNYSRGQNFDSCWPWLSNFLSESYCENLSIFNQRIIRGISDRFGIATSFHNSCDFPDHDNPSQRLVNICIGLSANIYISGPAAKSYLDLNLFHDSGIEVQWASYDFPSYPQLWESGFEPNVSIIDMIFNAGFELQWLKAK